MSKFQPTHQTQIFEKKKQSNREIEQWENLQMPTEKSVSVVKNRSMSRRWKMSLSRKTVQKLKDKLTKTIVDI